MNPQQIIKILLKLKLKNFTNFMKIKPNLFSVYENKFE